VPVKGKDGGPFHVPPATVRTLKDVADRARLEQIARETAGLPKASAASKIEEDELAKQRKILERVVEVMGRGVPAPEVPAAETLPPSIVREYAHVRRPDADAVGGDHTETVYWHPVLVLPDNGRTRVEFQLSDDVGRFRVLVAGHTIDGRLGATVQMIESQK
jgi:hypothetical protein